MLFYKMPCKGNCMQHKAIKPKDGIGRYSMGQKRCNTCEVFLYWSGIKCPCCKTRLRVKPKSSKFKNNSQGINK